VWLEKYDDRPIIACSTGYESNHAIGLIRISGFENLNLFSSFFSLNLNNIKPRYVYLTDLLVNGKKQDEVTLTFFKGPKSFNGENILEIGVHGNVLNIHFILEGFIDSGVCRMAMPGEFSFRALKNKKMTLSQVEGLDMFINGQSELALNQGLDVLNGELKESYFNLRESFLKLKASIEIAIDFADDVGEQTAQENFNNTLQKFSNILSRLYERTQVNGSRLRSPSVILLGKTNAGKSSLFNALLKEDRSIISPIAGTTRDYISENILIDKVNYRLVDTAGLRKSEDEVEKEGMQRAKGLIQSSFFKMLVINPFEEQAWSKDFLSSIDLVVFTHSKKENFDSKLENIQKAFSQADSVCVDLGGPIEPVKSGPIGPGENGGPIEPDDYFGPIGPEKNSGPIGPAIQQINKVITAKYKKIQESNPILIERHCMVIKGLYKSLKSLESEVEQNGQDIGIIDFHVQEIGHKIADLIGVMPPDEVLGDIFSNFCIGK